MPYDYSALTKSEDGISNTWRELYDESLSLPDNLLSILRRAIYLPHDFYDLIAAYYMLPSALCTIVPYLFLHGQSGTGKSTIARIASYLHGVGITSSSNTFAGIRNELDKRRRGWAEVVDPDDPEKTWNKSVELNTCMVWEDINAQTFTSQPNLYNMLKFGTNKRTSIIELSSDKIGENMTFNCFCPKIFSSITPLHLDDRSTRLMMKSLDSAGASIIASVISPFITGVVVASR